MSYPIIYSLRLLSTVLHIRLSKKVNLCILFVLTRKQLFKSVNKER